eukprot:3135566-Rhodomonas_salina.3
MQHQKKGTSETPSLLPVPNFRVHNLGVECTAQSSGTGGCSTREIAITTQQNTLRNTRVRVPDQRMHQGAARHAKLSAHEESVSWNWTPSPWREWCRENSSTVPASADASRTSKSTSGGCSGLKLDAYGALSELFASWLRTWFDFDFLTKFHEFLLDLFPPSGKEFRDLFPPDGVGELISASVLISCTYAPKFPRYPGTRVSGDFQTAGPFPFPAQYDLVLFGQSQYKSRGSAPVLPVYSRNTCTLLHSASSQAKELRGTDAHYKGKAPTPQTLPGYGAGSRCVHPR